MQTQTLSAAAQPRARADLGRPMILWGWLATMAGVWAYVRAAFSLPPEADFLDTFTRTGHLGWAAALLLGGGVILWLWGSLRHLREAMEA